MLEILDSLVATITMVLILSLVVQSLQQILKQLLNMKSRFMERELFAMFVRVSYQRSALPVKFQYERLADRFPEVRDLLKEIRDRLSGIGYDDLSALESVSKEKFLQMVSDLVDTGELEVADPTTLPSGEKKSLIHRIDFLRKARLDIEKWYDSSIAAFKDHYERRMKMWAFGLGALVVVSLNANLFEIYREFSMSKVLRDTAVRVGENLSSLPPDSWLVVSTSGSERNTKVVPDSLPEGTVKRQIAVIDSLVNAQSFSIMRWNTPGGSRIVLDGFSGTASLVWDAFRRNLFGWVLMTLLVGLGAPFWYDLLKTIVGIKTRLRGDATPAKETDSPESPDSSVRGPAGPAAVG